MPVKETQADRNTAKPENDNKQFIFKIYDISSSPKKEVDSHFLGDEIAEKWASVTELYLRKGEISVGFGTSYTEMVKPSVFNAVNRVNNYYKKAVHKGIVKQEEAQKQFSWILDCALAAFHCDETANFELALMKAKDPEQIIQLFHSVKIEKL